MIFNKLKKAPSKNSAIRGFTIVELLIVIVIIGILAAIVVVAYNGITTQANNTQTIQAVAQYVKALQLYAVDNGHYPIDDNWPCLGPHPGNSCGRIGSGAACLGLGQGVTQADFDTEMKKVMTNIPSTSDQQISCDGVTARGALYWPNHTNNGSQARIYYYLKGDQPCEGIGGVQSFTKQQVDDTTQCRATLPTV